MIPMRRFTVLFLSMLGASCHGSPPVAETAPRVAMEVVEPAPQPVRDARAPTLPTRVRTPDSGVFSEHDAAVRVAFPEWVAAAPQVHVAGPSGEVFIFVDGAAVGLSPPDHDVDFSVESFGEQDLDGDGIPNALDALLGAKKAVHNNAAYGSPYREMAYPNGDVPIDEGVCTDVLVRAFRNAGLDLQKELHEDIRRSPKSFPMVKRANTNIDHRRVKTLLPYFERQWESLPVELDSARPWLPGDVAFMNTMGDERPDHVGIVSDRRGPSTAPLIVNNWTDGYSTSEMDLATAVPITHRFRMRGALQAPAAHAGLAGVLRRGGLDVDAPHRQVVLVTSPIVDASVAELRRYERRENDWRQVGEVVEVTLGAGGMATGRGLHAATWVGTGRPKREGDHKSPAGVFALGTAFGPGDKPPYGGAWPWRRVTDRDVFVDDPDSAHYNSWQTLPLDGSPTGEWDSAEPLTMYRLGLVVEHNVDDREHRAGSAIFLHTWQGAPAPTLGCTAMERDDLEEILEWLDPAERPVLVQIPGIPL